MSGRRGPRGQGSVYQRKSDGLWAAVADLGRNPLTGQRQRRTFYGKTQRLALAARKQFERDLAEGLASIAVEKHEPYTVATWLEYWLEHVVKPQREPTTHDSYTRVVRNHIVPGFGSILISELAPEHIETWLKEAAERKPPVGVRTRQVALSTLKTALTEALARKQRTGVRFNAATVVRAPSVRRAKVPPPDVGVTHRLLAAARGEHLEAILTVLLGLALRKGEAVGLRWEDIDFDRGFIRIRRRVNRLKGHSLLVREGTKSQADQEWTLAMPSIVADALRAHRTRQSTKRIPTGWVFIGAQSGRLVEPKIVDNFFHRVLKRAGVEHKTIHSLRHDSASLLLAEGVPLIVVSQILRHANLSITADTYAHLTRELHQGAAVTMDGILRAPSGAV